MLLRALDNAIVVEGKEPVIKLAKHAAQRDVSVACGVRLGSQTTNNIAFKLGAVLLEVSIPAESHFCKVRNMW